MYLCIDRFWLNSPNSHNSTNPIQNKKHDCYPIFLFDQDLIPRLRGHPLSLLLLHQLHQKFQHHLLQTSEFSLKVFTEFAEFSDKNICHYNKSIQTCHLLCLRPGCYHSDSKTHVRDRIFKMSSIHALVIFLILWRIPVPFRENYKNCSDPTIFCDDEDIFTNKGHSITNRNPLLKV